MKRGLKKALLICSVALFSVAVGATVGAVTLAGYERKEVIKDPITSNDLIIAGEGVRLTAYYLDLDIWGQIDNTGYSFWAMVYKDTGSDPTTVKYIQGSESGSNLSYSIDRAKYDRIKFFRTDSTNDTTLATSTNYGHSYYTDTDPGMATDATDNLAFVSGKVTFQVTAWHGGSFAKNAYGMWR